MDPTDPDMSLQKSYHIINSTLKALKTRLEVAVKTRPKYTKNLYLFTSSGISCDELGVGSREMSCTLPLQIKKNCGTDHRGIDPKRPTLVFFLVPISVADPGCLSRIPDPHFSIPDPGSRSKRFRIPDSDPHQRI
jgi:hypothetical protein